MNSKPQLSVVMPVYDTPSWYLRQAVHSVMCQQGVRFELIVVDDGSDKAHAALRCINANYHDWPHSDGELVILEQEHQGVGAARNTGNAAARSNLIVVMDSDDIMMEGRLEDQWRLMMVRPDVDILGGNLIHIGPDGREIEYTDYHARYRGAMPFQHEKLLLSLAHGTTVMRRQAVEAVGGYGHIERPGTDWRMMKKMIEAGSRAAVVPRYFLKRRVWERSRSFGRSEFLQDLYEEWANADV